MADALRPARALRGVAALRDDRGGLSDGADMNSASRVGLLLRMRRQLVGAALGKGWTKERAEQNATAQMLTVKDWSGAELRRAARRGPRVTQAGKS